MHISPLLLSGATLALVAALSIASPKADSTSIEQKIAKAIPSALVQPPQPRKILIFSLTNGFRHKSIETAKIAFPMLGEQTGAFEAVVSDDLEHFQKDAINQFDAICFVNTTQEVFLPNKAALATMTEQQIAAAHKLSDTIKENLMRYINEGGAFVGIHAATDTFYDWPEYGAMIGGYFWGHPWRANSPVHIDVDPNAKNHPIVAHLKGEPLRFREEIYQHKDPYDSSKCDMLLRLDPSKSDQTVKKVRRKDNDFGVSWTKNHGKGRVFYCSIGHNHDMYWNPDVLSIYLNGIQWAMGDLKVNTTLE